MVQRGGTNWDKLHEYITEHYHDKVTLFINLTDGGDNASWKPKYWRKYIWLIYGNEGWKEPWGKIVHMPDKI